MLREHNALNGQQIKQIESLSKESGKSQSYKSRRDESKGMEKSMGKPAYSGNRSSSQVGYPDTMNRA